MAITVYHMLPGTGDKRTSILKDHGITENLHGDFSNLHCLFPTSLYMRQWQRRIFHPIAGDCYIPPVAQTLRQMASGRARVEGIKILDSALRPSLISSITGMSSGLSTLTSRFIAEMRHNFPNIPTEEIHLILTGAFDKTNTALEVSQNARRAADAYVMYDHAITEAGYIDPESSFQITKELVSKDTPSELLIMDGFYELAPAEMSLVVSLLKSSKNALIFIPVSEAGNLSHCFTEIIDDEFELKTITIHPDSQPATPWLYPASSSDTEIEQIARHIKARYISQSPPTATELENIMIVLPSLSGHAETLQRIFNRYGIPISGEALLPPRRMQGAWGDMLSMLRAVRDGYPRVEFARFLVSPFFEKIPQVIREKAALASLKCGVIKGKSAWTEALEINSNHFIFKALDTINNIKLSSTYLTFYNVLLDILKTLDFYPMVVDITEIPKLLARVLPCDEISSKKFTLGEFIETLTQILDNSADTQDNGHKVQVTSLFEVRGIEPAILYIANLRDGEIPSRPDIDLLLPDNVRRHLKLGDVDTHMELQRQIFMRLKNSATELFLSYPAQQEDKVYLPSIFLSGIPPRPYPVHGHYSALEEMSSGGGDGIMQQIKEIRLPGSYSSKRKMSVTEIDSYRRCPRRFCIERVLRMSPTEIEQYELEPMALGIIAHRVMEELIDGAPGSLELFTAKAECVLSSVLKEATMDDFFSSLFKDSFMNIVPDIHTLETDMYGEGFKMLHKEFDVEDEALPGIILRGKADRIDVTEKSAVSIIDYKTGAAAISSPAVMRGEALQLFLYAAMLRGKGFMPERVGIYSIKDIKVKWVPNKRDLAKGIDMRLLIDEALKYLSITIKAMRGGEFPANPINDNVCNTCHEASFCPWIHNRDDKSSGGADA